MPPVAGRRVTLTLTLNLTLTLTLTLALAPTLTLTPTLTLAPTLTGEPREAPYVVVGTGSGNLGDRARLGLVVDKALDDRLWAVRGVLACLLA